MMFEKIKKYFDLGLYSRDQVAAFVLKGKITPAQYEAITGDPWRGE